MKKKSKRENKSAENIGNSPASGCYAIRYQEEDYRFLMAENGRCREPYTVENYKLLSGGELVPYHGGMVIGRGLRETYRYTEPYPCYCYGEVLELIFIDGRLVTTVDHSRDMDRIRMNIDKGLRSLENPRDLACIKKFLRHAFVKRYFRKQFAGRLPFTAPQKTRPCE